MFLEIHISDKVESCDLDALSASVGNIITIGKKCKEVWNALPIDDDSVDTFQCHLLGAGGEWQLKQGQVRTECPKGLLSSKTVPCNGCMGRCVNIHPGRPKYLQRYPEVPVVYNGTQMGEYQSEFLKAGDEIALGNVKILVK